MLYFIGRFITIVDGYIRDINAWCIYIMPEGVRRGLTNFISKTDISEAQKR